MNALQKNTSKLTYSIIILFFTFHSSHFTSYAQGTINGGLVYDNSQLTPITNTKVYLKTGNILVDSTVSDANGQFSFSNLPPASYTCTPVCTKPWGGVNCSDALAALKHFTGMIQLTGLRLKAADVNGTGSTASADYLAMARRFAGVINNFWPPNVPPPGGPDWCFHAITLLVTSDEVITQQLKMLCAGDVNGSYVP